MQLGGHAQLAGPELPVVDERRRRWLDEFHEVGVRRLEVVDDGADLTALGGAEGNVDLDVEGVAGELVRGAQLPVDA